MEVDVFLIIVVAVVVLVVVAVVVVVVAVVGVQLQILLQVHQVQASQLTLLVIILEVVDQVVVEIYNQLRVVPMEGLVVVAAVVVEHLATTIRRGQVQPVLQIIQKVTMNQLLPLYRQLMVGLLLVVVALEEMEMLHQVIDQVAQVVQE